VDGFPNPEKIPFISDPRRVHLAESAFFSPFTGIKTRSVVVSASTAIPHAACNSQFAYLVKQTKGKKPTKKQFRMES